MSERINIGFVTRAHGIRGEICARTHDPESNTLGEVDEIYVGGVRYQLRHGRPVNDGWLLALAGVEDRNLAETLRGKVVEVDRSAVALAAGEVLLDELIGYAVRLPDGTSWGAITAIEFGPQDRLIVCDDRVERQVPYVPELVAAVDLEGRVVTVTPHQDWPEEPLRGDRASLPGKTR